MSEEEKKKIVSEPPPPTDEIDGEWGEDEQTLVREPPEAVLASRPAPSGAQVAGTSVAPITVPAKAAEASTPPQVKAAAAVDTGTADEEEDEEGDHSENADEPVTENEDDEDEDEEDEDDEDADQHVVKTPTKAEWIPDWVPYAVLGLLVVGSIVIGLGLLGGGSASTSPELEKTAAPAAKQPGAHP